MGAPMSTGSRSGKLRAFLAAKRRLRTDVQDPQPVGAIPPNSGGTSNPGQQRNDSAQIIPKVGTNQPTSWTYPTTAPSVPVRKTKYSTDQKAALTGIVRSGKVAVDLETKGLHPHAKTDAAIGAVIMRVQDTSYIFRELPEWWTNVMEDGDFRKIASNFQFDAMWMIDDANKKGNPLTQARNLADPMLKSQIAHTYRTRSGAAKAGNPGAWVGNDLKSLLQEYLGVSISKAIDHEDVYETDRKTKVRTLLRKGVDWTGRWSSEMEEYMLEDIEFLPGLDEELDRRIAATGQERAAWIEQDVVFGTAWMTFNGITPDVPAWRESINQWRDENNHLLARHLKPLFPTVQNFNSTQQLMKAFPEVLGGPLPNTRKSTLKQLEEQFYPIKLLGEYRRGQTRLKNWGPKYLDSYVCPQCFRFHPGWRQIGAETSRFSCSSPNLQQIPRAPEFRKLFIAAPGFRLASLDYSAVEVLAAAVFAMDPNLLQACATGDPHMAVAEMVYKMNAHPIAWENLTTDQKKYPYRQNAKIVDFGLLFGGGADGLVIQARDLFNVHISRDQAVVMIREFYTLFPRLKITKNMAYRAMEDNARSRQVEVVNAIGFRRLLEGHNFKPTSWLNTWIQSSAGYGIKSSFAYLREAGLLPWLCMQVHDELVFELPEDEAEDLAAEAKACLIQGMRDVLGAEMPVNVDVQIGDIWL